MVETRQMRPLTQREKEVENLPNCLYDPLETSTCQNALHPPPGKRCEICLVENVSHALEDDMPSEAMRWFIAFRMFVETQRKEREVMGC